jgi:hypothetical protein
MRATNMTFTQTMPVTKQAVSEDIIYKEEDKNAQYVAVTLEYKDADGNVLATKREEIIGEYFQLLMSEAPDFAPGKPANEYREQDLYYVIDMIRSR